MDHNQNDEKESTTRRHIEDQKEGIGLLGPLHIFAILDWIVGPTKGSKARPVYQSPAPARENQKPLFWTPYPCFLHSAPSTSPRTRTKQRSEFLNSRYQQHTPPIHSMITAGAQLTFLSGLPFNPLSLPLSFSHRRFPFSVPPASKRCKILRWIVRADGNQSIVPLQSDNGRSASQNDDARPPFDINLAVVLAGFAFEAYNSPPVSASFMLGKNYYRNRNKYVISFLVILIPRNYFYDSYELIQRTSSQVSPGSH
jgi:hypothetical protein